MTEKKCNCAFCETKMKDICTEDKFCSQNFIEFTKCEKCGLMYEKYLEKCPQCSKND